MRLGCIVGARPNFMKIAPILRAIDTQAGMSSTLIHTGQHYDKNLSDVFFEELGIKPPDISLGVGSGSHAKQTADVMVAVEDILLKTLESNSPIDRLVVVGDVNSTMAAAIAATKINVSVAHVEAGLRSFDREMPEEINRVLTDSICDQLLVSEPAGVENLLREGQPESNIHLVGNVMIDTLLEQVKRAKQRDTLRDLSLTAGEYGVVTLHRPSNVDDPAVLSALLDVLVAIANDIPLVFPIHPRTLGRIEGFGLRDKLERNPSVTILGPQGYLDFLCLTSQSAVIVTDSGGLQEESTALGVPCLTLRENTERPITCTEGTSTLIGNDPEKLRLYLAQVVDGSYKQGKCPELWDGKAAERIVQVLSQLN